MTKTDIFSMISGILGTLIGVYMEPYIHNNRNKIAWYIKRGILILLQYGLPILFLIILFTADINVDKWFVFRVCLFISLIFFSVVMRVIGNIMSIIKDHLKITEQQSSVADAIKKALRD